MKKNYWNPPKASSVGLLLIAAISVAGMGAVERFHTQPQQSYVGEKLASAKLARRAFDAVKEEREQRGVPIDPLTDPTGSGLIGCLTSPVTSNNGHLPAKQTTVNPNFAAVLVQMFKDAGLKEGETVAVGFSGSFPALNICVLAAIETLKLRPVIVSSASASQWGANQPELLWIDMERALVERGIFSFRSAAASIGGINDLGTGMGEEGLQAIVEAIDRNKLTKIEPADYLDSVNQRLAIYRREAGGLPIRAYVNVGGGATSVGTSVGKAHFDPGLNLDKPPGTLPVDSVMARFSGEGVPVIHLVKIDELALRYGLPLQPPEIPPVGDGQVYAPRTYNPWLAAAVLAVIVAGLFHVARSHAPFELPANFNRSKSKGPNGCPRQDEELAAL